MSITKKEFLKDVAHEINQLKNNATKEELTRLDFSTLNPNKAPLCIYGQITGSCENKRTKELMNKSCIRVVHGELNGEDIGLTSGLFATRTRETFRDIKKFINGSNESQMWDEDDRNYSYLSSLETYILLKGAKNKHIIDYLQGKVETLSL